MKGATSRQKPTQRRLDGMMKLASGLFLPGSVERGLRREQKARSGQVRTTKSGLKVVSHGVNMDGAMHTLSAEERVQRRNMKKVRAEVRKRRRRYKHGRVGVR